MSAAIVRDDFGLPYFARSNTEKMDTSTPASSTIVVNTVPSYIGAIYYLLLQEIIIWNKFEHCIKITLSIVLS